MESFIRPPLAEMKAKAFESKDPVKPLRVSLSNDFWLAKGTCQRQVVKIILSWQPASHSLIFAFNSKDSKS